LAINGPLKQLRLSLLILIGLTASGTFGLMAVGERGFFESVYMTMIVLTTVGMEGPVSDAERGWGLVLMVGGIGTALYATGQMVSFMVEGQLKQLIGRHKVTERISKLDSHFIVTGFGRMGQALCATLAYRDCPFVLIDSDPMHIRDAEELGYLCIEGDAMQESILEEAGIVRARGLVACLPRDADNVMVTLTARGLKPDMVITTRCEKAETQAKLRRAGADRVICPAVLGAERASHQLLNPEVEDMLELDGLWPDLELSRVSLTRFPGFTACTLAELQSKIGQTIIIALIRSDGTRLLHPQPQSQIEPDDQVVIIGGAGCVNTLVSSLTEAKAA
jgi:voltage-gated potassium channel